VSNLSDFRNLINFLSEDNVLSIADDIVSAFEAHATPDTLEIDFNLKKGGRIDSEDANTFLLFDPEPESILDQFKTLYFSYEIDPDPGKKPTVKQKTASSAVRDFLLKICSAVSNTSSLLDRIRKVIYEKGIVSADPRVFPLYRIELLDVDVLDLSSMPEQSKYTVAIKKMAPPGVQTPSVAEDLFREHSDTGEDFNDIISRKKAEDNPIYKYVDSVEMKKSYFECKVSLFVDYSPIPQDQFEDMVKNSKI